MIYSDDCDEEEIEFDSEGLISEEHLSGALAQEILLKIDPIAAILIIDRGCDQEIEENAFKSIDRSDLIENDGEMYCRYEDFKRNVLELCKEQIAKQIYRDNTPDDYEEKYV